MEPLDKNFLNSNLTLNGADIFNTTTSESIDSDNANVYGFLLLAGVAVIIGVQTCCICCMGRTSSNDDYEALI
jgi:hypothetical protein